MNSPTDNGSKALDATLEWAKQITTLSAGALVLSATFIGDVLKNGISYKIILIASWSAFALSTLFGILLMGNICFLYSQKTDIQPSIYDLTTRSLAIIHLATFFLGVILFMVFAALNL